VSQVVAGMSLIDVLGWCATAVLKDGAAIT